MAEANKDEANKCKQIAQSALSAGDSSKATRFLQKAKRMCPDDASIDALLEQAASYVPGDGAGDSAGPRAASPARPAEGPRHRSAPTTGSAGQGSAGARNNKAGKPYTPEMMQQVQKVLRSKDYYEILGIPKDSSEDVVKKAYKKLALKLHPDKNHAPGAEEAFKKVSKCVQCLTNVDAKQAYDRYGDEDHQPRGHQRHQQDFMTPEDLFNAFFGGGTFQTGGGGQRQNVDPQDQAQAQRQQLFQVLPVLLIVFLSLVSNFGGQSAGSRFSLTPSAQYQNERTTAGINVPFYVTNDFEEHYGEGTRAMAEFEKQVEIYYVRNLHSECDYQEKVMYKKVMLAKRRGSSEELEKARNHPKPACKDLDKIKRKHSNLYRSALYMGY